MRSVRLGKTELECSTIAVRTWSYFFFQAEDGIRDYKVTGVQTCALPIFLRPDDQLEVLVMALSQRLGRIVERHDEHAVMDLLYPVAHCRLLLGCRSRRRGTDRKSVG